MVLQSLKKLAVKRHESGIESMKSRFSRSSSINADCCMCESTSTAKANAKKETDEAPTMISNSAYTQHGRSPRGSSPSPGGDAKQSESGSYHDEDLDVGTPVRGTGKEKEKEKE
eukprot:CAMPEP_0197854054 /NCGR_PEP_ID=MMETSP1438-20131217/23968_1 /TAXON_ID=1461541 /ORGANISM="Pterosperma sp., Strain CCMP1384" /LENGTH=113 /DNA_ID=CAMNT_0043468685 /DNA_START=21 /DNA_END=359 /DNA_ORIENTATION=-